jgi:enoyl-CoA hydratase/carnithine racemase
MVNVLRQPGDAVQAGVELAGRVAANPPRGVAEALRVARLAATADEGRLWAETTKAVERILDTEDVAEGVRAFIEKREPRWTGR